MRYQLKWIVGVLGLAGAGVLLLFAGDGVQAAEAGEPAGSTLVASAPSTAANPSDVHAAAGVFLQGAVENAPDDTACILCHVDTDASIELASGDVLSARVDLDVLENSAHGAMADTALSCTSCHNANDYQYPHAEVAADDLRAYEIARSQTCESCHVEPHITSHPGAEADNPVVCTDCHGAHDVEPAAAWTEETGVTACVDCHVDVGVEQQDPQLLANIVEDGLFARQPDNQYCLACHSQPGLTYEFPNGDTLFLTIDEEGFHSSVHVELNESESGPLVCADCHEDYQYPHEPIQATTEREYHLEKYTLCNECHIEKYEATLDDSHGRALAEGNEEAAVCTDCHGAHSIQEPGNPPVRISTTCGECHVEIFDEYATSVHGESLIGEGNEDVPTCIECHGVHGIGDPNTALFRNRSPQLCAECHADEELMTQYDISTDVFETYVADFHGTTVTLFEAQDPTVETNKAVCYDCHGVHDIRRPDDPNSGIKANLLATCQECHPDANENFPNSWTSHFKPSLDNNPMVFLINWFYRLVIPGTVGFFGFLVATDIFRRVRMRLRGEKENHS
jgi:predicted CXXCH cytochrome family protein